MPSSSSDLDIDIDKRVEAANANVIKAGTSTTSSAVTLMNIMERESKSGTPRNCVLHKTPDVRELGFSVARIKNYNEHIINDVVSNSLADLAGLKPNDILLEVTHFSIKNFLLIKILLFSRCLTICF